MRLLENERFDLIQKSGYGLVQNEKWFAYGIDAVLVSYFAQVKKKDIVVDLGTGTGIIPLLVHLNHQPKQIYGVEKQERVADMARRSIAHNHISSIEIVESDINDLFKHLKKSSASVVISNPPYFKKGNALVNSEDIKSTARHETSADLEDFIRTAADLLQEKGCFYMVHRPMRLVDIMVLCRQYRLEPKNIQFVYPSRGKVPNIVLIKCVKNGQVELKYEPNLYVYEDKQKYSQAIYDIYAKMQIDVFEED